MSSAAYEEVFVVCYEEGYYKPDYIKVYVVDRNNVSVGKEIHISIVILNDTSTFSLVNEFLMSRLH